MKLSDLIMLRRIFSPHMQDSVSVATAYKLYKLINKADEEQAFYARSLNAIIEKYGERGEDGKLKSTGDTVKMSEAQRDDWQKEVTELDNLSVDYDVEFTLDELSVFTFSIADMAVLSKFIKEFRNGGN